MAEGENILVKETYQGALKNYSSLFIGADWKTTKYIIYEKGE